jgi:hypothetical protein
MQTFSPATRRWFAQSSSGPTGAQSPGWPVIAAGRYVLINAATGRGKAIVATSSLEMGIDRVEGHEITQAAGSQAVAARRVPALDPAFLRNGRLHAPVTPRRKVYFRPKSSPPPRADRSP